MLPDPLNLNTVNSGVSRIFERWEGIRPQSKLVGENIYSREVKKGLQFESALDFLIFVSENW